ncbi:class I adenylate-forming enzyme family protein [Alkalihalophilus sp. As8PL]|uniref:Class I adenylate-forming enzyme family protein n=1 Tax=Alkalihalophilus sp. As8PL TaxID=3237103 RepID=A0AB39BPC6_9BACI
MENVWMQNWPEDVPKELTYRLGKKPLHHYLEDHAKNRPDQIAYLYYGREITWQELNDSSNQFANFLVEKGVERGDRVGLFMQNCPQYIVAHYGAQKLGAIVCPLNPMYKETELEYLINESGMRVVISADELYARVEGIRGHTPSLEVVVTTNYGDYLPSERPYAFPNDCLFDKRVFSETYDLDDILKEYPTTALNRSFDVSEDVSLLVFTSGTTGRPKGAMLTFENALFKTAAAVETNGARPDDVWLAVMPLCHIAGMVMGVNIPVYSGTTCVLLTKFEPEAVLTAIEKYQVSLWYSVAPMNAGLLQYPGLKERKLGSLRRNLATSFGIPVTAELAERWKDATGGCEMYEASYGLSETHTCDTFMPADKVKFGSCGIPVFNTDIRIVQMETGEDQPVGKSGEIVIKSPGVFKGYWNRPDATRETLRDGWVHTGDIGYFSEDGYLFFSGRVKEMIKSSGYSVFPEDVEAMLMEHPAIAQVAVVGVPDEVRGESVKAYVVPQASRANEVTEDAIIKWSKEKMAAYKYPRFVEFRSQLPATSSGKVLRRLLKEGSEV